MQPSVAVSLRGTDELDSEAWLGQLEFLAVAEFSFEVRMVLSTMTAKRLLETAVVSEKHYALVSDFLDYLRNNDLDTDPMSEEEEDSLPVAACDNESGYLPSALVDMPVEVSLRVVDDLRLADLY
ncbi:hypothetical protein B0H13DRAFT_2371263 [Mycena leptocephala]|nr:hypothetical protein B0H13DRAFT_2371263 [Mycena leptocephala]